MWVEWSALVLTRDADEVAADASDFVLDKVVGEDDGRWQQYGA